MNSVQAGWIKAFVPVVLGAFFLSCKDTLSKFHSNGKKSETYEFRIKVRSNGQADTLRWGKATEWDDEGNMVSELIYTEGKLDGLSRDFYRDGKERVRYHYKDGKLDSSIWLNREGKIYERFRSGKNDDTITRYGSDGKVSIEIGNDPID